MDSEEESERVEIKYKQEYELLKGMFEDQFSEEVVAGVLEDCDGDVNLALDTLTNIHSIETETVSATDTESQVVNMASITLPLKTNNVFPQIPESVPATTNSSVNSYSLVSQTPAASSKPKRRQLVSKNLRPQPSYWTEQISKIVLHHKEGNRTLIIMRGAPGSGKTFLAKAIVESTVGSENYRSNHIFSADDFFLRNGRYVYDVNYLSAAHTQCLKRASLALTAGLSPVIIDNTNIRYSEMRPYATEGVNNGYIVEVVEPNNSWSKNAHQLSLRNIHSVPKDKIQRMLNNYDRYFTGEPLLRCFDLTYPSDLKPPIQRNQPLFEKVEPPTSTRSFSESDIEINGPVNQVNQVDVIDSSNVDHTAIVHHIPIIIETPGGSKQISSENQAAVEDNEQLTSSSQANSNERAKVEVEWDAGNTWDTASPRDTESIKNVASLSDPKPQRTKYSNRSLPSEKFIETSIITDDWSNIAMLMPPWDNGTTAPVEEIAQVRASVTSSTGFETGDYTNNNHKILLAYPRDINENYNQTERKEKIPNQRRLDKSSTTQDPFVPGVDRCTQEDKHFKAMKKTFKNISRPVLREIFDQCNGDVNWASDVVLDDLEKNAIQINTVESESEGEDDDYCECWAKYNIIPDENSQPISPIPVEISLPTPAVIKKSKKDKTISDDSVNLKRQIEKNIIISDNHYSEHQLRIRRVRENRKNNDDNVYLIAHQKYEANTGAVQGLNNDIKPFDIGLPGTSNNIQHRDIPSISTAMAITSEPGTSGVNTIEDVENNDDDSLDSDDDRSLSSESNLISVTIGMEFVKQLDVTFGRADFVYPDGVKPVLNIPKSILHQINALWIESISNQMDSINTQTIEMIEQDAELARQLSLQLDENQKHYKEAVKMFKPVEAQRELDFKEIMDNDLALAIYEKEVKEMWKSKEPQDIAAKMTREKLYKLFPEVNNEVLSEFLMAHGNNFMDTVEAVMASTGLTQYFEQENPIEAFIKAREKEVEIKELEPEEKVGLNTKDWPSLMSKDGTSPSMITLEEVENMRERAENFKTTRDKYFNKAQMCYSNNKLQEASFYSRRAAELTAHYDRASSYAAAMLMHLHASNNPDTHVIDLHFLRVSEASTSLDLFIDNKINKMRSQVDQGIVPRTLVLHVITGRGKHSPGRARIKPAVIKRLTERGITFRHQNAGLLEAKVKPTHQLTDELITS